MFHRCPSIDRRRPRPSRTYLPHAISAGFIAPAPAAAPYTTLTHLIQSTIDDHYSFAQSGEPRKLSRSTNHAHGLRFMPGSALATIVIVTKDRKQDLRQAVESALKQTAPVEVLV